MTKTLLIVTCGDTDLQAAVLDNGVERHIEFAKGQQREAHEILLAMSPPPMFDEKPADNKKVKNFLARPDKGSFRVEGVPSGADARPTLVEPMTIVPAKLAGLPKALRERPEGAIAPSTVVVFNTKRDKDDHEPIAAGPLIAKWLGDVFGLVAAIKEGDIGDRKSGWINYLVREMRAEGEEREGFNPRAVAIIDRALEELRQMLRNSGQDVTFANVCFAMDGGMPNFREQIRAIARFRFPEAKFWSWSRPERKEGSLTEARIVYSPAESFRARQTVRDFVGRGEFHAAWGAAQALKNSRMDRNWIRLLDKTWGLFDGRRDASDFFMNIVRLKPFDSGTEPPTCLIPALRAEAALRSNRIQEAISWTSSFHDSALVDCIKSLAFVSEVTPSRSKISFCSEIPVQLLNIDYKKKCLEERTSGGIRGWYYLTGGDRNEIWYDICKNTQLRAYNVLMRKSINYQPSVANIRNSLIHSSVLPEEMQLARNICIQMGLWASTPNTGFWFLKQQPVTAVMASLSLRLSIDAACIYQGLIDELVNAIESLTPAA